MNSPTPAPKHGLAAGDFKPPSADWTIEQGWDRYTPAEHATWKALFERQSRLLPGRACDDFMSGLKDLPLRHDEIPHFEQLSDVLEKRTGWRIVAVPGLVPDEVFFNHLAHRRFPAGQFIRKPDQLVYLEEPDVFHDVFGHAPMLMNPVMAEFIQARAGGAPPSGACWTSWRACTGTRSSSASCSRAMACASTARASCRRRPNRFLRWRTPRPTASDSIWSA